MTQPSTASDLSWLLDDLVDRVGQIQQAVLLSKDGLVMGASANVTRDDAEHLAAISAGVQSLANGACDHFSKKEVRQTIIEMDDALFFVCSAGSGSCLAVLSDSGGNAGLVGYEMAMLTKRLRKRLTAAPRLASAEAADTTSVPGAR
ncbi:roadblock/LC7 domain-containing protein [Actinomadura rudentiformis]|uniref:Roadblock/LC7 domain-containing protein n=1 Tax=Actinomadura rudentiformis TaxID=359158 RepID=A0A6H9YM78_9ACTN|nr:roadblock/LC7 domain-containing protein [Actinomadura rudentiformis]KAB2341532.1 roadblock/LC7 domain-containing protein [Actinomadura rudentiformis]